MLRILYLTIAIVFFAACASVPESIRGEKYGETISIAQVQHDPSRFIGQNIRWGGVILGVQNLSDHSVLEVLAYPLDKSARPKVDEQNLGRFLLHSRRFLDPAIYKRDGELTAIGTLSKLLIRKIGEYNYRYPVIDVHAIHLWPARVKPTPYYYDPWYPWYGPYRRYPY